MVERQLIFNWLESLARGEKWATPTDCRHIAEYMYRLETTIINQSIYIAKILAKETTNYY